MAFMTYFTIILNAMMSISRMFVIINKAVASGARIQQVLDCEDDMVTVTEFDLIEGQRIIDRANFL